VSGDVGFAMVPGWQQKLIDVLYPKLTELAARMADGARNDCHVISGHLRDSIYFIVTNEGIIIIGADAPYAIWVECGHYIRKDFTPRTTAPSGWVAARPFLRPQLFRRWSM
jgi:hypothetical protein